MSLPSRPVAGIASRISGPGELIQAVPYLLGFHPARSLVLVGLHDGLLVVTARLDLDESASGVLEDTVRAMCTGGTSELIAAVWDDRNAAVADHARASVHGPADLPWGGLIDSLERVALRQGVHLIDALLVAEGRLWSYMCTDDSCCPSAGRPMPAVPSEFVAAATVSGVVALPDRETLAMSLDPLPDDERDRLREALTAAVAPATSDGPDDTWVRSVKRALFAAARRSGAPRWAGSPDVEAVRLGAALRDRTVRDAVWLAVDGGRLDGRALWRDLARRLPAPYDAAPLFLYGWASWRAGDGALARIAADRAVVSDPDYNAADLLLAALSHGVDPRQLPRLRAPDAS